MCDCRLPLSWANSLGKFNTLISVSTLTLVFISARQLSGPRAQKRRVVIWRMLSIGDDIMVPRFSLTLPMKLIYKLDFNPFGFKVLSLR